MPEFAIDIKQCLETLSRGGLILYPTDTIWGIGCDATNTKAVGRIYQLKKRSDEKSMIVLVTDEKDVLRYVKDPEPAIFDYLRKRTRPTTVVYTSTSGLAENLVAGDGSIAIRICNDNFCRELIKSFGKPVVSTSANFSGETPPPIFGAINEGLKKGVDYIVKYRQDDPQPGIPSTVIKWEKGQPVILRT